MFVMLLTELCWVNKLWSVSVLNYFIGFVCKKHVSRLYMSRSGPRGLRVNPLCYSSMRKCWVDVCFSSQVKDTFWLKRGEQFIWMQWVFVLL